MTRTAELRKPPASFEAAGVDRILSVVLFGAQNFMKAQEWSGFLQQWLERLGEATASSHVRIFANDEPVPGDSVRATLYAEWRAPTSSGSPVEMLRNISYAGTGCERWVRLLSCGEPVVGLTAELPECERPMLESQGCISVAIVPVFVEARWWGFMMFSDCVLARRRSRAEVDALSAAAGIYGAALARQEMESRIEAARVQEQLATEIGETVTSVAHSLDDTLHLCSTRIATRLGLDLVRIWTMASDGMVLSSHSAASALGEPLLRSEVSLGEGAVGRVAASRQSEVWCDALPELWPGSAALVADAGLVSGAAFPLLSHGRLAGVVAVLDRKPLSQRVLAALESVTDELALAIERSRAVAELDLTENRYRRLVEATLEGVVIHDGRSILDANPSLAAMVGLTVQDIIGRNPFDFVHPDSIEIVTQHVSTGSSQPYEAKLARADGSGLAVEMHGRDFVLDGVKLRVTSIRDLTERKTAQLHAQNLEKERAARELSERHRAHAEFLVDATRILSSSFDTSTTLDQLAHLCVRFLGTCCAVSLYGGDDDGYVALVHGAAHNEAHSRRTVAEWKATTDEDQPLRDRQGRGEVVIIDRAAAEEVREHALVLDALGAQVLLSVPIVAGGNVMGSILFIGGPDRESFDVLEQSGAEELGRHAGIALQAAQSYHAALAATAGRDEILAVVAHDLRNPLNTIYMGSKLALDLMADDSAAPGRRQLEIIVRSAEQMNRLIQDLLDATRLQTGQLALELVPARPRAIIDEALEMLRPLAAHAGITLEADDVTAAETIHVDRLRIQQVLSNLIGNALKFTPSGGSVRVSAEQGAGEVRFRVSDTGPGIPEDQLPQIFGRFWQARRTDRRGLGLGLAIARGIVEAHGGTIHVDSAPGAGSTFAFTIPSSA
ncbi:MAG TPA: ATP-binding protein [Longimicrobiales bacterium]|nr:ATP-binding protein [Longimicrobiales bacterium]